MQPWHHSCFGVVMGCAAALCLLSSRVLGLQHVSHCGAAGGALSHRLSVCCAHGRQHYHGCGQAPGFWPPPPPAHLHAFIPAVLVSLRAASKQCPCLPAGVAPRAKMNQQRSRRFRKARDDQEVGCTALKPTCRTWHVRNSAVCSPVAESHLLCNRDTLWSAVSKACCGFYICHRLPTAHNPPAAPLSASGVRLACCASAPPAHSESTYPLLRHIASLLQNAARAERKGEAVDPNAFDSNCITPGTAFMARLSEHLCFFVRKKIAEDPAWQRPHIIFSGGISAVHFPCTPSPELSQRMSCVMWQLRSLINQAPVRPGPLLSLVSILGVSSPDAVLPFASQLNQSHVVILHLCSPRSTLPSRA